MSKIKTLYKLLRENPAGIIKVAGRYGCFNWIPDKGYLKMIFLLEIGKELNLDNPQTYNEKLQWLKLYDRKPEYSTYVDKYAVRSYVRETIGEQYLVPLLGVYESVKEIDWDTLPKQFVLKCTHGSHCNIICRNKDDLDVNDAANKLTKWLKQSWYWFGREWPYHNVSGKIVCEQYLGDIAIVPNDYKIMCFNGEPKIIQIHKKATNEMHTIDFYDINGDLLPFRKIGFNNSNISRINVESLGGMIELARKLSKGTFYLRTDFYLVNGKAYFGELTFFDSSGFIDFEPKESNVSLGEMINLEVERSSC